MVRVVNEAVIEDPTGRIQSWEGMVGNRYLELNDAGLVRNLERVRRRRVKCDYCGAQPLPIVLGQNLDKAPNGTFVCPECRGDRVKYLHPSRVFRLIRIGGLIPRAEAMPLKALDILGRFTRCWSCMHAIEFQPGVSQHVFCRTLDGRLYHPYCLDATARAAGYRRADDAADPEARFHVRLEDGSVVSVWRLREKIADGTIVTVGNKNRWRTKRRQRRLARMDAWFRENHTLNGVSRFDEGNPDGDQT